jgi:hypothetical protein
MKTLKSLLAVSLVLAAFQTFASAQEVVVNAAPRTSRAEQWITHYYQNPRPDDLPAVVHQLSRDGYFEKAGQPSIAIGFFATVFSQNPQNINYWLRETSDLPVEHRRILAAAAWQAGSSRGAAMIRELSTGSSNELQNQLTELIRRGPAPVASTQVRSEASMNLHWGAFLASGSEQNIVAVLTALGSGENNVSTAARYSLAQNAVEHRRVVEICRAQLDRQPEPIRSEIRAALNQAATRQPGA